MEADGLTQLAVHEQTQMSQGALSRYANGENRPPIDQFEKLTKCFSQKQRVLLLLAYLADDVPESFRSFVRIEPAGGARAAEEAPVYRSRMPSKLREAYDGLGAAALEHEEIADSLIATWSIVRPRDEKK